MPIGMVEKIPNGKVLGVKMMGFKEY